MRPRPLLRAALLAAPLALLAPLVASAGTTGDLTGASVVALVQTTSGLEARDYPVTSFKEGQELLTELSERSEVVSASWSAKFERLGPSADPVADPPATAPSEEVGEVPTATPSTEPTEPLSPSGTPSSEAPDEPSKEVGRSNDTLRSSQWALDRLGAEAAWSEFAVPLEAAKGITVAVVDGGVDASHEDFTNPDGTSVVLSGYDALSQREGATDPDPHGTHVAGTIGAVAGNALGVAGLAPGVRILPVDVFGGESALEADVANGVIWAADHGADVINLSLGLSRTLDVGTGDLGAGDVLEAAVDYASAKGAVVVAAAGNNGAGKNELMLPASYPLVVSVAATGPQDRSPVFSESNAYVDLSAPGVCVVAPSSGGDAKGCPASPDGYASIDGTSMAAPHVSAVAALAKAYWSARGETLTGERLAQHLRATSEDLGDRGRDNVFGDGIVDLRAALATTPAPEATSDIEVKVPSDRTLNADAVEDGVHYAIVNYADGVSVTSGTQVYPLLSSDEDKSGLKRFNAHCFPRSGSPFLVGTTEVYCSAVDDRGFVAAASFDVTVNGPGNSAAAPGSEAPAATRGGSSATFANCDAVDAAGRGPIKREDPDYDPRLDRDGDGVACEDARVRTTVPVPSVVHAG